MAAQRFDLVVVGSGTGLDVANWASQAGWRVAIVEKGPLGGTCLNRGCIPSKLLIHSADVMQVLGRAHLFGIHLDGAPRVDWPAIVRRVTASVDQDSQGIEQALQGLDNPRLFQGEGRFTGPKRLQVRSHDGTEHVVEGDRFLLATGARPRIPDLPGLREVPFLTSTEALRLEAQPRSLVILGGGYIAAELAHFYGSLGTEVTIVQRRAHLLPHEDEDIARAFTAIAARRHRLLLRSEAVRVRAGGKDGAGRHGEADAGAARGGVVVTVRGRDGQEEEVHAEALLVAVGVQPNSDTLDLAKAGVDTDERGFIRVDAHLRTSAEDVYALGDAIGRYLFKHAANHEAPYVYQNLRDPEDPVPVDYHAMPHAVFSGPQVAGVGATEAELRDQGVPYLVGRYRYRDTAMGHALEEEDGFVKFLVHRETAKILGCHILGPEASTLLHEVVVAMRAGDGTIGNVTYAVHIHPALNEVVDRAATSLQHPAGQAHGHGDGHGSGDGAGAGDGDGDGHGHRAGRDD